MKKVFESRVNQTDRILPYLVGNTEDKVSRDVAHGLMHFEIRSCIYEGYLLDFFCSGIQFNLLLSPYPCFISLLYLDLYVLGDDALIS